MKKFLILFISSILIITGQTEVLVNSYQDTTQQSPAISRDGSGNYIIVWNSLYQISKEKEGEIYFSAYDFNDNNTVNEVIVNDITDGNQEKPAVAQNSNSKAVFTWSSNLGDENIYDIKAKVINAGIAESEFLVNSTTINSQTNSSVDVNNNGGFVIAWDSWDQDGGDRGVYAKIYDQFNQIVKDEFLVNQTTAYSQAKPTVKIFPNGNIIIIWESWKQDIATPSGYGIFSRIFDEEGNPITDEFQINTYTNDYQWFGDVEVFDDNSFVVVWCSWEQDGFDGGIYLRLYDESGNPTSGEGKVNTTTTQYQWLPKVTKMSNNRFAVVWGSWLQDGDREGVYFKVFRKTDLKELSFETRVNDYTNSFQWEPDVVFGNNDDLIVTYSTWGQFGNNSYDIAKKRVTYIGPQGGITSSNYNHISGISTSKFIVHVIDSTALTGNEYEVSFILQNGGTIPSANVKNISTNTELIQNFQLSSGEGAFYLTEVFEGVAIQFLPDLKFELDLDGSYFENNSNSDLILTARPPASSGSAVLAPIDVELIFGNSDTLSDGTYAFPSDTAFSNTGQLQILTPFKAWNITDNQPVDMFIIEPTLSKNNQWDPGETITLLTPQQYQTSFPNFHGEVTTSMATNGSLPKEGDKFVLLTKRPLTENDKYRFITIKENITSNKDELSVKDYKLYQNYPNPFNPITTIKYDLPKESRVVLSVFNILGEKVITLVDQIQKAGTYKNTFNGNNLASGVYFYRINIDNKFVQTKKLMLIK